MGDTAARVKKILAELLGVSPEAVTPEAHILDDLGADSLDTVEIVMAVEEDFRIEIADDAMESIRTVSDLIALVERATAN